MKVFDTLINFVSGLGTAKDPVTAAQFTGVLLDRTQIEAAYRNDWIVRKAIDIPAFDMTRAWRAWQADNNQIEAIEAIEKDLLIQRKTRLALVKARLYGGAAMVLGVDGTGAADTPLEIERVKQGSLRFIHVMARHELSCGQVIDDIQSPWYGEPEMYTFNQRVSGGQIRIHPSRVVRFIGAPLPDYNLERSVDGWGDSILQYLQDCVKAYGMTIGGITNMVNDAKMDVIRIPGLSQGLANKEYAKLLTERFAYSNMAKSMINTLVMDKDEEWDRVTTNFGTLPDLVHTQLLIVSGAADIPATRMLGQSPKGLNATGESDVRNYYDRLGAEQTTDLTPAMKRMDDVTQVSANGRLDPNIFYIWNSLWQMGEKEKAETAYIKAQAFQIDVNAGLVPLEALKEARENQLIEDGTYPGLDAALEKFEAIEPILPEGIVPKIQNTADPNNPGFDVSGKPLPGMGPDGKPVPPQIGGPAKQKLLPAPKDGLADQLSIQRRLYRDMRPRPLYVWRPVVNASDIIAWAKANGFETTVPAEEMHVTVAYSKQPLDWMKVPDDWYGPSDGDGHLRIPPGGPRVLEMFDEGAVVLRFATQHLQWRHNQIIEAGASYDYNEYKPHITLSYTRPAGFDPEAPIEVAAYNGPIVLGPEVFEEITGSFDPESISEDSVPVTRSYAADARTTGLPPSALSSFEEIMTKLAASMADRAPPVVNVTLPPRGRVVKDVKHDEHGRVSQIIETEDPTDG